MSTRNTPVLREVVEVLFTGMDQQTAALSRLENNFHDRLLMDVGDTGTVAAYAQELRLRVDPDDCSEVLDYIGEHRLAVVNIDVVETAINDLLGWNRFIEP